MEGSRRNGSVARSTRTGRLAALRRCAAPAAAVAIIGLVGLLTRVPDAALPAGMVERFSFARHPIASVPVDGFQTSRRVQPQVAHYAGWMSGVGAAVALTDADGNGADDDACLVDPRTDTVTVSPAATTGARYAPFVLDPAPLPFSRTTMAPMGCLPGDFDEDGRTDFIAYYWGRTPVVFLRRGKALDADAFRREELAPRVERWYTDTIGAADVDGDGHTDLIVGNYFPDGARLLDPHARRDPAMAMQSSMSRANNGGTGRILLWDSPGQFRQAPNALPKGGRAWTLAIGAHDLNGDLRPELYFANDFGQDWLLLNRSTPGHVRLQSLRGRGGFTVPKSKRLGEDSFKGMGIDFADMNGDGRTDMFVSNISSRFGLMETHFAWINDGRIEDMRRGVAPFSDRSEDLGLARSGWGWDAKFGDFLNGGAPQLVQAVGFLRGKRNLWPQVTELAMANDGVLHDPDVWPNIKPDDDLSGRQTLRFFARGTNGRWANIARAVGVEEPTTSRGVATADVNRDGLLDFAVANQWAESSLYVNRCRTCGRSVQLRLLRRPRGEAGPLVTRRDGRVAGRAAIGARVTLTGRGRRPVTAEVDAGNGHASVRSGELHVGLGRAGADEPLTAAIAWRARGRIQRARVRVTPGHWTILLPEAR